MKRWIAGALVALAVNSAPLMAEGKKAQWTIKDSVELSYFMLPNDVNVAMLAVQHAKPVLSPDGAMFYVLTERGDVEQNVNLTELRVYAVADVQAAFALASPPSPRASHVAHSRISGSMDPGIKHLLWAPDGSSLTFLEYGVDKPAQVRRLDTRSGEVRTLTDAPHGVSHFTVVGDMLVHDAMMTTRRGDVSDVIKHPFSYVRDKEWFSALQFTIGTYAAFVRHGDGTSVQASTEARGLAPEAYPSPDGRWAIIKKQGLPLENIPDWARKIALAGGLRPTMQQYFYLKDLHAPERAERFIGLSGWAVSNGSFGPALWNPDSASVVIVNAFVPTSKRSAEDMQVPGIFELRADTFESREIGTMRPSKVPGDFPDAFTYRWLVPGKSFVLEKFTRKPDETAILYSRKGGRWVTRDAPAAEVEAMKPEPAFPSGLQVGIRQGLNQAPQLIASRDGRDMVLWDPNPWLATRQMQPIELVHWTDAEGRRWDGHLVVPSGPKPQGGYPLVVVLAHETYPKHFMPDGYAFAPGNAAQEMAARGMVQLTLNARNPAFATASGTREGPTLVAGADAAVAMLARQGLIDPSRVGVMGYSRMGWGTLYLSTHHRGFVPAAAIVQDAWDASYVAYVQEATLGEFRSLGYSQMYTDGPGTFWEDKQAWMDAPGFMMDKMQSPLLIQHHYGPYVAGLLTLLEPYAALRNLGRPVEAVAFNGGAHIHTQPAHRQASMQLAVDWMRFWLKGEVNSDPAHADRNGHWQGMRDAWKRAAADSVQPPVRQG